ncbi:hypothetical protein [Planctomycetes bacterium Poly30]|uniref:hypothetical protein n=1 Tax=Saltatorellus ferox TaxID=2528018 RepID=UPI0011A9925A
MKEPENRPEDITAFLQTSGAADSELSLDGVALDLVRAATDEGDDAVVRTLLRAVVALGLTRAATFWTHSNGGARWEQRRGFGGTTPEPNLLPGGTEVSHGPGLTFSLGPCGALVVLRETFDRDGQREVREEAIETLVLLAETLLSEESGDGEFFQSEGPGHDPLGDVPGPLPHPESGGQNRRQAG